MEEVRQGAAATGAARGVVESELRRLSEMQSAAAAAAVVRASELATALAEQRAAERQAEHMLCYATLRCGMLCYAMPCHTMPCHAMLCQAEALEAQVERLGAAQESLLASLARREEELLQRGDELTEARIASHSIA